MLCWDATGVPGTALGTALPVSARLKYLQWWLHPPRSTGSPLAPFPPRNKKVFSAVPGLNWFKRLSGQGWDYPHPHENRQPRRIPGITQDPSQQLGSLLWKHIHYKDLFISFFSCLPLLPTVQPLLVPFLFSRLQMQLRAVG